MQLAHVGIRANKAVTRERFAASAWKLGCAGGYDAIKIRTIAEDVGVSGALIYSYFEDKAALMDQLRCFGLEVLETALAEEMSAVGPDKLLRLVNRYVQYMREHVWLYGGESKMPMVGPLAAHAQCFIQRIIVVLDEGAPDGLSRAGSPMLALHLWLSLQGVVQVPPGSAVFDQAFVDGHAALCVAGVAPTHMHGRPPDPLVGVRHTDDVGVAAPA